MPPMSHRTRRAEKTVNDMAVKTKTKKPSAKTKNTADEPAPKSYPRQGFARVSQAAEFLSLSVRTVYRMVDSKEIPSVPFRDGDAVRIPWEALHAILDRAMNRPAKAE